MNILDLFKHYNVKVEQDGSGRYRAVCPLHPDKDPSLKIYSDTNTWWCFGCYSGSRPVDFIMLKEKCSYFEALDVLSKFEENGVDALRKKINDLKNTSKVTNKGDVLRLRLNRVCKRLLRKGESEFVDKIFLYCDEGRDVEKTIKMLKKLGKAKC